jgi:branched-chain amino acid transport system ATP-binding protein
MTAEPLLRTEGLRKAYGAVTVTDDVSLAVAAGELHAIIGPNGAGKTTLIHQLSGLLRPDAGRVIFDGSDISGLSLAGRTRRGMARTFQITSVLPGFTALENVELALQARDGSSFRFLRPVSRDARLRGEAAEILSDVDLRGRASVRADVLSYGERRQLELAIALATKPKLLLLDEPLAGTTHAESARIVDMLRALKGELSILLIEHDMEAVFSLADSVSVLVYGRVIASGAPASIRADPAVRTSYLGDETEAAV